MERRTGAPGPDLAYGDCGECCPRPQVAGKDPATNPARGALSVVIPAYNEEATIAEVLRRVAASPLVGQIIVIDDGSTDGTAARVEDFRSPCALTLLRQPANLGKGAAVRRGFAEVTKPIAIVQDADLECDPAEYGRLVRPILRGKADVVFGSRFLGRGLPSLHTLGNRLLSLWSNLFTRRHVTDVYTCYKVIRSDHLARLNLKRDRFDFEVEFAARVARLGLRAREVPISYRPRTRREGKKIGWRDAFEGLLTAARISLWP